jgi:hypothetical protein
MRSLAPAVVLVLLGGSVARAADPQTPRIGPETGAQAKAERVLKALSEPEAAAWRARVRSGEIAPRDLVHRILLEKDAAYKAAVFEFDKGETNAEDFQKIVARVDAAKVAATPLDAALRAQATFFMGRSYLARDEFDLACVSFDKVRNDLRDATAWTDEATFFLGYAYARRPELEEDKDRLWKARARNALETLAPTDGSRSAYPRAPERSREAASWLLKELSGEGSGPLLELARRMETVEHSIDHERTGKPTQKKQEQIITEIDRLIALMREKEQNGDGKGGGGKGGGKGGKNASGPARRSALPPGLTPGEINPKKQGGTSEWGDMKEKDREQVIQALKDGKFPPRYIELVEQYFKELAKAGTGKRPTPPPAPENKDK